MVGQMVGHESSTRATETRYEVGVYPKRDVVIVRGQGALLWDEDGREYIDCVGGQGSVNIGHAHPAIAAALAAQAGVLITCPGILYNDRRAELLSALARVTPPGLDRFFLCNSGTEAVEGAFKFARLATGRTEIVAAMRGFHGRTMGALAATWEKKYREPFQPLMPGVRHVPFDNVEALDKAVGEATAAVLLEPVQGEGGVRPASPGYLRAAAELCRERGALLIDDEVQSGFGRTGRMWACEHEGVVPDILCMAKSMAGGIPMGAVALGPRVGEIPSGVHGSTFGGSPLACAAALAALRVIEDEHLVERAAEHGAYLLESLRGVESPAIHEVRGKGLMAGVELKEKVQPYLEKLLGEGVLALPAGPTVLRLLPPLVITREQIDRVVQAIARVLPTA
jgi:acetylornithine/LysW-gamma-L-lysine aminotransferase